MGISKPPPLSIIRHSLRWFSEYRPLSRHVYLDIFALDLEGSTLDLYPVENRTEGKTPTKSTSRLKKRLAPRKVRTSRITSECGKAISRSMITGDIGFSKANSEPTTYERILPRYKLENWMCSGRWSSSEFCIRIERRANWPSRAKLAAREAAAMEGTES